MIEWIHNLAADRIPFYTYRMKVNDCLIYTRHNKINQTIIILHGILIILKVFTNGEKICIAILSKNNLINLNQLGRWNKKYYYQAIAIEESWIICFKSNYLYQTSSINIKLYVQAYNATIWQQEIMNQILIHKEIRFRLIQLIIYLSEEFGYIQNQSLTFNFNIQQNTLALIIGSNKVTVNKIIKNLEKDLILKIYKKKFFYILSKRIR